MGRQRKLTPELQKKVVDALADGNFVETAAKLAHISKVAIYDWIKRGRDGEEPFAEFAEAVESASAIAEQRALHTVLDGDKGWQSSAWFLERRFPQRWAQRTADYKSKKKQAAADLEKSKAETELLKARATGDLPDDKQLTVILPDYKPKGEE